MKQERNNEMDLLLRRLSRDASDSSKDGNHLDADELSSYAENALPAAARAQYTEHMAECASCRKLVAQLSSSVGVVSAAETSKLPQPSALRKFLASLFSPMVLRYAVPALGLIVVAVIGLTILRRDRGETSVAQLTDQEQTKAPTAQQQPEQVPSPSSGVLEEKQEKSGSPAATPETRSERSKESQPAPPPNAPSSGTGAADVSQAAPIQKPEQQPAANEPAAPKPAASDEIQKRSETEARKQETQGGVESERPRGRVAVTAAAPQTAEDRKSENDFMTARAPAKTAGVGSAGKLRRDGTEDKDKNDAETRSVAGRRFRRERGVWIDTAYDSSRSTVSLTRGSEQYRALVADEPAIKTIADQLDGEIIVVWKGRAYRIR